MTGGEEVWLTLDGHIVEAGHGSGRLTSVTVTRGYE